MKSANITRTMIVNAALIFLIGLVQIQAQTSESINVNAAADKITEQQRETIENIVREYLLNNPSIIREATIALQIQEEKEKQELAASNMKRLGSEIFSDPNSPTAGNIDGDVSVVAFFDYNCGYCKQSLPALRDLLANDQNVRIIYKEFPILNPQSHLAAQAALAAHQQGKYVEFHDALTASGEINDEFIKTISDSLGLDYEKLKSDMSNEKTNQSLANNYRLASDLGINGTPAYIVGTRIVPGAVSSAALADIVASERAKLSESRSVAATLSAQ